MVQRSLTEDPQSDFQIGRYIRNDGAETKWSKLCSWAESHGSTIEPRLVADSDGGIQLCCGHGLDDPGMLIEVPRSLWIEVIATPDEDTEFALARKLAEEYEKGADSFWAPYVQYLPSVPASALSLTPTALEALPFGVSTVAKELRDHVQMVYETGSEPAYFLWALGCVWSRAFRFTVATGTEVAALVPLGDAFNHADNAEGLCTMHGFDGHDFFIGTKQAVGSVAMPVSICYRPGATDVNLLVQYGFCLEENRHAEAAIELSGIRLVVLTSNAVGVLPHNVAVRLHESPIDWDDAAVDEGCAEAPPYDEVASWIAALDTLVTESISVDRHSALRAVEDALRAAEIEIGDHEALNVEAFGPLAQHVLRLRVTTALTLRIARGRMPWLLESD